MFRIDTIAVSLVLGCGVVLAVHSSESITDSSLHRFRRQAASNKSDADDGKCTINRPLEHGYYLQDPKTCPPSMCYLPHGSVVPTGRRIFYKCYEGYILSSRTQSSMCKYGRWSPELPTCVACGSSTEIGNIKPLIVDGKDANIGSFPWHAGLYFPEEKNEKVTWVQQCGGSLISPRFVVTAAHCVIVGGELRKKEEVRVALGKFYRSWDQVEDFEQKRNVSKISYQPDDYSRVAFYFDIALVMMDKKVEFDRYVMPICTGVPYKSNYILNQTLYVAGWGRTESGRESDVLQYTDVTFLPRRACERRVPTTYVLLEKVCAVKNYSSETVVRQGDSGGGLTVVYNGRHYIVGIVSVELSRITLFTNINWAQHKTWMENELDTEIIHNWSPTHEAVEGGCLMDGKFYKDDESFSVPGYCNRYTCSKGVVGAVTCAISVLGPGCRWSEQNTTLPYPHCCVTHICENNN